MGIFLTRDIPLRYIRFGRSGQNPIFILAHEGVVQELDFHPGAFPYPWKKAGFLFQDLQRDLRMHANHNPFFLPFRRNPIQASLDPPNHRGR